MVNGDCLDGHRIVLEAVSGLHGALGVVEQKGQSLDVPEELGSKLQKKLLAYVSP